ncbi:MAG: SH3 domain-containing protein [Saprospiraceae bacterium]|nr:SH3 domain-containing protein [Saprospiraceae bacterium]
MRILSFLFILFFTGAIWAQNNAVVIATGGLKLRATPGQSGKTLALAPFGARVQVLTLDKGEYGQVQYDPPARRDTIGVIFPSHSTGTSRPHVGYWLKVRYAGKTGFMFSGFLADPAWFGQYGRKELNNQFRLRTTDGNAGASNDPEFDPGWNWYAVYESSEGKFDLKKVQLRYATEDFTDGNGNYNFYPSDVVIMTEPPVSPHFLIGTRKPWNERSDVPCFWWTSVVNKQHLPGFAEFNASLMSQYGVSEQVVTIQEKDQLPRQITQWHLLGKNGERQEIVPLPPFTATLDSLFDLIFAGDLDGDGRLDYIFSSQGEMGYYVLYLSSQAHKGELARPAAVLWTWYTC